MVRSGAEQVAKFNWYRVARGVLAVYHEVHKQKPSQPLTVRSFIPMNIWTRLRDIENRKTADMDEKRQRFLLASRRR
jgi:hypothetical protein